MKILLLTLADKSYQDVALISKPNKIKYCEKHGYKFYQGDKLKDGNRHASWNKILYIKEYLMHCDWIFWTDADSLVMNHDVDVESLINRYSTKDTDFMLANDDYGINCGQMLLKRSHWTMKFLDSAYAITAWNQKPNYEQNAIDHLLKNPMNRSKVSFIPKREINSYVTPYYQDYKAGDFIVHFPGLSKERYNLIGLMRKYAFGEKYICVDAAGTPLKGRFPAGGGD